MAFISISFPFLPAVAIAILRQAFSAAVSVFRDEILLQNLCALRTFLLVLQMKELIISLFQN